MKKIAILFLTVIMIVGLLTGCGSGSTNEETETPAEADEIVIGTIQPISGQISVFGIQSRDAVQMAVDEINAAGGVLGKQIRLVVSDDAADPEKTLSAFTKQVTQDKIVALVGALTSKCSNAIAQEAQTRKVLMVSPTSTADNVTSAGDYIFRACYNDSFQGGVVAKFAYEDLGAKTAAILFDNTNDYSKGLKDNFTKSFTELGGTIVSEDSYATGDADFSAQITKMKGTNPDVIFLPDYYNPVNLIAKQIRTQGITVPMLGADGWDGIEAEVGDEILGCYFSNHYSPNQDDTEVKDFVAKYEELYDITPNALAALAYDATYMVADAIEKAGTTEPEALKAAMMETDKKFVTGQISFNELRNPVKPLVMVKLVAGDEANKPKVEYAATVQPK